MINSTTLNTVRGYGDDISYNHPVVSYRFHTRFDIDQNSNLGVIPCGQFQKHGFFIALPMFLNNPKIFLPYAIKSVEKAKETNAFVLAKNPKTDFTPIPWALKGKTLRPYQNKAIENMILLKNYALFFEPRVGKTATVISAINYLKSLENNWAKKVLILVPKTIIYQWKEEFEAVANINADNYPFFVVDTTPAKRKTIYDQYASRDNGILIMSIDTFKTDYIKYDKSFERIDLLIIDEAHSLVNFNILKSKVIKQARKTIKYLWLLTGTVVTNDPANAVQYLALFYPFMSPNILLNYFFSPVGYTNKYEFKNELKKKMFLEWFAIISKQVKLSEANPDVDINPAISEQVKIKLSDPCFKAYSQIESSGILTKGTDAVLKVESVIGAIMKLRQLCLDSRILLSDIKKDFGTKIQTLENTTLALDKNHQNYNEILNSINNKINQLKKSYDLFINNTNDLDRKSTKTNWIINFIKTNPDKKILIFSTFRSYFDILEKDLEQEGILFYRLDGKTTTKKRNKIKTQYQNKDDVKVFLGQVIAAGTGITLDTTEVTIFADLDWSNTVFLQAKQRMTTLQDKNSHKQLYILETDLPSGIEEYIIKSNFQKGDRNDLLNDYKKHLKRYDFWKNHIK